MKLTLAIMLSIISTSAAGDVLVIGEGGFKPFADASRLVAFAKPNEVPVTRTVKRAQVSAPADVQRA